jgi:hypothetical protein
VAQKIARFPVDELIACLTLTDDLMQFRDTLGGKPTPAELAKREEGAINQARNKYTLPREPPRVPPARGSFAFPGRPDACPARSATVVTLIGRVFD